MTVLLEHGDGSCRDVNFEEPTWDGVDDLLESLQNSFAKFLGTDAEGNPITAFNSGSAMAAVGEDGHVHLVFEDPKALIKKLQVFVCREEDGIPFVELTFFPEDVEQSKDLKREFLKWTDGLQARLEARRYFIRTENASWRMGDTGKNSGVFWVSELEAPDR